MIIVVVLVTQIRNQEAGIWLVLSDSIYGNGFPIGRLSDVLF